MRSRILCFMLALGLFLGSLGSAYAEDSKEIELKDGSVLAGEIVSLNKGIYTVKSDVLGIIKIEESKVRAIREKAPSTSPLVSTSKSNTTGEVQALQQKMMSNKEILDLIQSLQNDPEFKIILEDPKMMDAVQAGDVATLLADPRFMKLLNNPTVRQIQKKVQ